MKDRASRIKSILQHSLDPVRLDVVDDSARHAGHAGAAPGGETHFSVLAVSDRFRGQNRVDRSRVVHQALDQEFAGGLHALALTLRTPEEQARADDREKSGR
jgi:BolA protein